MSETKPYQPELGQMLSTQAWGRYEMPRYAEALFFGVWEQMARVFWNREQRSFDERGNDDPKMPGFTVRPYWWGDEEAPDAELPNFVFGEVTIHWYKWPGRGMSCNVSWTPDQWVAWFDAATVAILEYEQTMPTIRPADERIKVPGMMAFAGVLKNESEEQP